MIDETRENYDSFVIPQTNSSTPEDDEDEDGSVTVTEQDGKRQLVGYAVVWGAISAVCRDGFRHRFAKGVIKWANPTNALWAHDISRPLASTSNGTLTITEDDHGAKVTIDLDDTTDGVNTYTRVKNKLVTGMSFGGKRLAYDRTPDPKVIDVTSFVADDVTVTISPSMQESNVVTAANADALEKQKKLTALKMSRTTLDRMKLALLKPTGKASA